MKKPSFTNAVVYNPVYPEKLREHESTEKDNGKTFHKIIEEHRYYNVADILG